MNGKEIDLKILIILGIIILLLILAGVIGYVIGIQHVCAVKECVNPYLPNPNLSFAW